MVYCENGIGGAKLNLWPFGKKKSRDLEVRPETSTMDRLLERRCSKDEFFLLYSKLLQERLPGASVEFIGESVLHIVNKEGKESTTYLDNLWLKYSQGNEDRAELIQKYAQMATGLGAARVVATRQNIVAMIKDLQYIQMLGAGPKNLIEHLCGDLWIVYAVDQSETISTLTYDSMIAAAVSENELRALAVENLGRILPEVERNGDGPWYQLTAGSDYAASLLLFDGIWNQVAETLDGHIVATVPTRDVLMYTGSQSASGLSAIRERSIEIANNGAHAISDSLIVREGGKWTIFNAN
jgi:uncharacterized protein YtpQ (UPF0354 family)